jgi:hypothetical protein
MLKLEGGTFKHEDRRKVFFFRKAYNSFPWPSSFTHLLRLEIITKIGNVVQSCDSCDVSVLTLCEMEMRIDFFTRDMPLLHFRAWDTLSHSLMDLPV